MITYCEYCSIGRMFQYFPCYSAYVEIILAKKHYGKMKKYY